MNPGGAFVCLGSSPAVAGSKPGWIVFVFVFVVAFVAASRARARSSALFVDEPPELTRSGWL
jgi:hypothetical protein